MEQNTSIQATEYVRKNRRWKTWQKLVGVVGCLVIFCTTYALILPAITMEGTVSCGYTEHIAHTEEDGCYTETKVLTCTLPEGGHVHDDACYQTEHVLTCGLEECAPVEATEDTEAIPGHTHDEACYADESVLVCTEEVVEPHTHTDACYTTDLTLTCELPIHEHTKACYADTTADVESQATWENTLSGIELTGVWADDVISIAQSQLGYTESTQNYIVTETGAVKGYSRYGAWYGDAYGDWCAMFASFCLHYAEVDQNLMPQNASCPLWIQQLSARGIYRDRIYTPQKGDLIFFDWENDGVSDHVGLVVSAEANTIRTIEGNSSDRVQYVTYPAGDSRIAGYGVLPENPNLTKTLEEDEPKSEFIYQDDEVTITASLEDGAELPENTTFEVIKLQQESAAYQQAKQTICAYTEENSSVLEDCVIYDMHFLQNGEELEPNCAVTVSMQYNKALTLESESDEPTKDNVQVLHLAETNAGIMVENVTQDITLDADGAVQEAVFETTGFSEIAVVSTSVLTNPWINKGADYSFTTIFGAAVNYGIIANTIIKGAHMDTTFAVKALKASGNVTTGMYINNKYGGAYWIGSIDGTLQIDGSHTKVYTTESVKDKLTVNGVIDVKDESTVDAYVDSLMSYVGTQVNTMAGQTTTRPTQDTNYFNNGDHALDLTAYENGTYYLSGDYFFGSGINGLKIAKNPGQTVVFNFSGERIYLQSFRVVVNDIEYNSTSSDTTIEPIASTIVFNMPNCTDLYINSGIAGLVLAPKATLHGLGGTSSGWLVVDTLDSNNSEWHFVYQNLPEDIPTTAGFYARKLVNNQTPSTDEVFSFTLDEWQGDDWETIETVQNRGEAVQFTDILYKEEGEHWYRVSEVRGTDSNIDYSTAQFIYKIVVSESEVGNQRIYSKTTTTYRVDPEAENKLIECNQAEIVFRNQKTIEKKTSISARKVWDDGKETLDHSEDSIQVQLYQNGTPYGEPVSLSSTTIPAWYYQWDQLDALNDDGQAYEYTVKEISAIDGYTSEVSETSESYVAEGTTYSADLMYVITNRKEKVTSIQVEKQWLDPDGTNVTTTTGGSITFDFYQVAETENAGQEGTSEKLGTYTISQADGWKWSRNGLPAEGTDDSGNTITYRYYVVETEVSNYVTTYKNNKITDGTIIIVNQKKESPSYVLPETGGMGTTLFYVLGAILVLGAGVLLITKKRMQND